MLWQMLHLSRHEQMLFAEHSPRGSQAIPRLYGSLNHVWFSTAQLGRSACLDESPQMTLAVAS